MSRFQAEVAGIMELLLKVAVLEIGKVFEGRTRLYQDCACSGEAKIQEDLRCLPDLRAFREQPPQPPGSPKAPRAPRAVRSVGVQAGEPELEPAADDGSNQPRPQDPQMGEHQPPTEVPLLDMEETIDVLCTVDLPCTIFKEQVTKSEIVEDLAVENTWHDNPKAELSSEQNGPQSPDPLPIPSPLNSTTVDIPSTDLIPSTLEQSDLAVKEAADSVEPVSELVKAELLDTVVSSGEKSGQTLDSCSPAASGAVDVVFRLNEIPVDYKVLQPCSVQLVNLLCFPETKKRMTDIAAAKGSSVPKDLRIHQHNHTGRRLCCFAKCGDGVWSLRGSLSHRQSLSCKICGKQFKRRKILRRHKRFHTGDRPYSCSKCDKTFALRKSLRRHERFHTGERPHSCPQCGKSFRLKDSLKAHMRFHTGEKPFSCSLCTKEFRIQKNLDKHALVHSVPGRIYPIK